MSQVEWKEYTLGDFIKIKHGFAFKGDCISTEDNGVVLVTPGNFAFGGGFQERKCKFFTDEYPKEYVFHAGDLIVTMTDLSKDGDTLGYSAKIPETNNRVYLHNQRIGLIQFLRDDIIDHDFLYWFMRTPNYQKGIVATSSGSTVKHTSPGRICESKIFVPPLEEQKRIAGILSSLDDKIELNNKINDNLEKQAQALFKNWFIDYAPFGGEELIDSPIEIKVPKSLKMIQVNDYPHIIETGRRPKGGAVGEGIPSIGAENVKELGVFDYSSNKFIPREFAETLGEKGKINGYELLLYKDGGKPGTFMPHFSMFGEGYPYEECYINEHVFKVDFGDKALNIFAYFYFQTEYVVGWLANNGGKAAIPGINQNDVNAVWIYNLNNPKVKEFGEIVKPMFEQILKNCKQNRELSIMRDVLLSKLL